MADGVATIKRAFAEAEGVDLSVGVGGSSPPPAPPPDEPPAGGEFDKFRETAQFDLSDLGNALRFVAHAGEDMMFVPRVGWHVWNGRFWEKDADEIKARMHVQRLPEWIRSEAAAVELEDFQMRKLAEKPSILDRIKSLESQGDDISDEDKHTLEGLQEQLRYIRGLEKQLNRLRSTHRKYAVTSGNSVRFKNALSEASVHLAKEFDSLDPEDFAVNAENFALRFSVDHLHGASIEALPHDRDLLMTKQLSVCYDVKATAPTFDKFIERILPDEDIRKFLQRWFGLSMTGFTGEQAMVFLYGVGKNGKSVLVDLIARILGTYSATARIESLTGTNRRGGSDATPDLIPLMGARMVRTSEPDEGQRLQEGLIKELTGGEPLLVRELHSGFVEISPVFKLTMSGNHKPEIRGTDDGIWRRILLTPFDVQIPEEERDKQMGEKLWTERNGVLNWLIAGLTDYMDNGLQIPNVILDATKEYRRDSDPIMSFLLESCEITSDPDDKMAGKDLVDGFILFSVADQKKVWGRGTISRQLKEKSERWKHPEKGTGFTHYKSNTVHYRGIKFTDEFQRFFNKKTYDRDGNPVPDGE